MRFDLRFALRMIAAHRWFSAAIIATLAFGIGLNTMVFTLIDAAEFKPVPVPNGERLIAIVTRDVKTSRRDRQHMPVSWPDFVYYRSHTRSLEALEGGTGDSAIFSEKDIAPQHYRSYRISPGLFGMLGARPERGRDLVAADAASDAAPVVLIGYSIWKERYGGRDVLGRIIRVNGKPAMIVGIMPKDFRFPSEEDAWMPLAASAEREDRGRRQLQLFGLLKHGATLAQAAAEFDVLSQHLAREYPKEDKDTAALVQTFHQRYNGDQIALVFWLLMGAVALVLLIACANVANMLLGRALARSREISIRVSLGASRWQIVRQLLIESLLLSLFGGIAGLALSAFGVHAFDLASQDVGKPYWVVFAMDYRVFFYFAIICVVCALLFGLVPALRTSRVDVNSALKEGVRSMGTRHGSRLSGLLIVFQFGLTLVLLLGAGAFMRSFVEKQKINPWVHGEQLITGRVSLPEERYKDADSRRIFFDRLIPAVAAIPGVRGVAITSDLPGTGSGRRRIEIEGAPLVDAEHRPNAAVITQFPGYFRVVNLPLLRGRDFNAIDGSAGHLNAIVTQDFARRNWPNQDPLGRRFRFHDNSKPGEWISVIGVSADIVQSLDTLPDPVLFLPWRQDSYSSMAIAARANSPLAAAAAIRSAVQKLDLDLPVFELRTMAEVADRQIWFLRVFGSIFLVFATVALVIASVGIYAVMAQATGSRTQEIGVRMALGATPEKIAVLILRRGVAQLLAGLSLGAVVALPVARTLGKLPFLQAPSDPAMMGSVVAALWVVGLFACWLPARRAAALNPVSAMRND
jgi:putative ABC transport system permease protein